MPATNAPLEALALRARVVAASGEALMRGELATVLRVLPLVPWPSAPATGELLRVPLRALFELDRNLHAIGRYLPLLLAAMSGSEVERSGWLALIYDRGSGFWFDFVPDYLEALAACRDALDGLRDGGAAASSLMPEVARLARAMAAQAASLARATLTGPAPGRPSPCRHGGELTGDYTAPRRDMSEAMMTDMARRRAGGRAWPVW